MINLPTRFSLKYRQIPIKFSGYSHEIRIGTNSVILSCRYSFIVKVELACAHGIIKIVRIWIRYVCLA